MARNNKKAVAHPQSQKPPHEMLERFLDVQEKELSVRAQELTISSKHEDNNKTIAEKSIAANLEDRKNEREHVERKTKLYIIGFSVFAVIAALSTAYALQSGNANLVIKGLEILAIAVTSFFGGYGLKAARVTRNNNSNGEQN